MHDVERDLGGGCLFFIFLHMDCGQIKKAIYIYILIILVDGGQHLQLVNLIGNNQVLIYLECGFS